MFAIDGGGPAASVADDLERAGLKVERLATADVAAACARFYDAVADRAIKVRPSVELDESVAGVARRPMGDRFIWSRSASVGDVTPLAAASWAYTPGPGRPPARIINLNNL